MLNDIQILKLESVLGPYTEKKTKILNPMFDNIEGDMALHAAAPLRAQSSYDSERLTCGSMVVGPPNNEERSQKVEETQNGVRQYIIHLSDHSCVRIWNAITQESSNGGALNFYLKVQRVCTID